MCNNDESPWIPGQVWGKEMSRVERLMSPEMACSLSTEPELRQIVAYAEKWRRAAAEALERRRLSG
jgi:hypothetical protein